MSNEPIPYHRNYGRVLIVLIVLSIPLFLLVPVEIALDYELEFRIGFPAMSLAAFLAPVLTYAGIRTRNLIDFLAGIAGMTTLFFWVPRLLSL